MRSVRGSVCHECPEALLEPSGNRWWDEDGHRWRTSAIGITMTHDRHESLKVIFSVRGRPRAGCALFCLRQASSGFFPEREQHAQGS